MILTLSDRQYESQRFSGERRLRARLIDDIRRRHPAETAPIPPQELTVRIDQALHRARARGIAGEAALAAFATLGVLFGPMFDAHPAIARLLDEPDDTPDKRLNRLSGGVPDIVWGTLRRQARA